MKQIKSLFKENVLLKMTSLNAAVIGVRLGVSFFIQRLLAEHVGEAGIAKVGSLRNLIQMLTSVTSVGVFNGVVKYLAEYRSDEPKLQQLFSSTLVFITFGSVTAGVALAIWANPISIYLFATADYSYIIQLMAVLAPFIALQRVSYGVVNGLSAYKKFAKIELVSYLISAALTVWFLFSYNITGVLFAIALTPFLQFGVLCSVFYKVLKAYIPFSKLRFATPMAKPLLAFSLMSFFSTVLLNYVEIDIRALITEKITEAEAGLWTAMTYISKNYMVFSNALFTLYVLPKFASLHTRFEFTLQLKKIFKTLLPLFGAGMLLVYFTREWVIALIYRGFTGMEPLFKWQLMGDFVRLASVVLAHQFLAKKMVRNFIFTEVLSLALFYLFAVLWIDTYGIEGVVMGHFVRYLVYFVVVIILVYRAFKPKATKG